MKWETLVPSEASYLSLIYRSGGSVELAVPFSVCQGQDQAGTCERSIGGTRWDFPTVNETAPSAAGGGHRAQPCTGAGLRTGSAHVVWRHEEGLALDSADFSPMTRGHRVFAQNQSPSLILLSSVPQDLRAASSPGAQLARLVDITSRAAANDLWGLPA